MNSFNAESELKSGSKTYTIYRLDALKKAGFKDIDKLPFSIRVLLENLLRTEDGKSVTKADIEALASYNPKIKSDKEIAYTPARVVMQDFTGVPAVVDLAAMRDAIAKMGGDPAKINPLQTAQLVIDHSVQVDYFGDADSLQKNIEKEYERNGERYQFLRWGQQAFQNFSVVPPGTGIVHQVNLENLATVVFQKEINGKSYAYPDTLVGTDSHTTMINGVGVLGWGVGGIEAEAAMLGQAIAMLIPQVVGFKLKGKLSEGVTATDLVLTVTQQLRAHGCVGKFVEFFGDGLESLPLADRATIANMAPEYGATMGFFPVDQETLNYMRLTGRDEATIALTEAYLKEQGLFRTADSPEPVYTDVLELDLSTVQASLAGPKRPQDRVLLSEAQKSFRQALLGLVEKEAADLDSKKVEDWLSAGSDEGGLGVLTKKAPVKTADQDYEITNGSVVIAAITSCTNTSNPAVMLGAGLVAKKAVELGLQIKPWVKSSLAPGSKVVAEYLKATGLLTYLEQLHFNLVGYGCTTCIGNSGPLPGPIAEAITEKDLVAVSVLSGNRNFEGRVNPHVKANYLASPPLVVAYALAGTMDIDLQNEPIAKDKDGKDVYLKDIWPSTAEVKAAVNSVSSEMFSSQYKSVFEGDDVWQAIEIPAGETFAWDDKSTYVKHPPYFENMKPEPDALQDVKNARVLALLGDSVTTDHISPAGSIAEKSPAGAYLKSKGIAVKDFNSYGSRRGNHEIMMRGTFANIRLRNQLAPGTEGGITRLMPEGEQMSIFEASEKYKARKTPLVVLAGKEYGTGSSRDWAGKGPALLGIKVVIAESYERIHRSNLIGMGVLPLQFQEGQSWQSLGLTGEEEFSFSGIADDLQPGKLIDVTVNGAQGEVTFKALCRIDTLVELDYYKHGGILQYVLRQLVK